MQLGQRWSKRLIFNTVLQICARLLLCESSDLYSITTSFCTVFWIFFAISPPWISRLQRNFSRTNFIQPESL